MLHASSALTVSEETEMDAADEEATNFALYPGVAIEGIIDYSTTDGRKYFDRATAKVSEELFDANPEGLYGFVKNVEHHAQKFGWTNEHGGIFWIPEDLEDPNAGNFKNLLASYGEMSLETIREWEETYLNTECREAQDSVQAYYALQSSLSETGLRKVNVYESQYKINGTPSGLLFWKIILRESHLDTNATAMSIRVKLGMAALERFIADIYYDITKFNQHVLMLLDALQARGEQTHDLLSNLFSTYATVKDEEFRAYMTTKRSEYEDGTRLYTHSELMVLAENKYKNLRLNNKWSHESYDDKIMALEAKQAKTNKELDKIRRKKTGGTPKGRKDGEKGGSEKNRNDDLPDWMFKEPAEGELKKPRKYQNKDWWYCSNKTGGKCEPGQYHCHKPSECHGNAKKGKKRTKPSGGDEQSEKSQKEKDASRKLKVMKALLGAGNDGGDVEMEE